MKKLYSTLLKISSTLSVLFAFVTNVNSQCQHTLRMMDTWGDGWNGASVDVYVSGVLALDDAACTGSSTDAYFDASDTDLIDLVWTSGSYDNEISFEIIDGDGVVLYGSFWGDMYGGRGGMCPTISCHDNGTRVDGKEIRITIFDAACDGSCCNWGENGKMQVCINGVNTEYYTSGCSDIYTIPLSDGDDYSISWIDVSTNYANEHSYEVAVDGQVVGMGAEFSSTGSGTNEIFYGTGLPDPPTADFTVNSTSTTVNTSLSFSDLSTGSPTGWSWDFGDGGTSTSQNPVHTYTVAGVYTVVLTASNTGGSDDETKTNYITVANAIFTWTGGAGNGDWDDGGNWDIGTAPTFEDNCIIPSGIYATVTSGGSCADLTSDANIGFVVSDDIIVNGNFIDNGGVTILNSGGKIDVTGDATIARAFTVNSSTAELEVDGTLTLGNGYTTQNWGTIDCNGVFNSNGATIDQNTNGNIEISGTITSIAGLDVSDGTVTYDGGSEDIVSHGNPDYHNLVVSSGTRSTGYMQINGDVTVGASVTLDVGTQLFSVGGDFDLNGTMNISTGTLDVDGDFDVDGNLTVSSTGRVQIEDTSPDLSTFSCGTGTVEFDGSSSFIAPSETYYDLEIDGSNSAGVSILGATVTNSIVVKNNSKLTVFPGNTYSGSLLDINGTLSYADSWTITGSVDLDGVLALSSDFNCDGVFDATSGEIQFANASSSLYLGGGVTSLGTIPNDEGTVVYDAPATQFSNDADEEDYTGTEQTITSSFWTTSGNYAGVEWSGCTGSTVSSGTGPSSAQTGSDYFYVETSSWGAYYFGDIAYLTSSSLSGSINIDFWYHSYGSDIGMLELETYDGSSWTSRWSIDGLNSNTWVNITEDLSAYTVDQIRFKYTAAGGYRGDIALDNIVISSVAPDVIADTYFDLVIANTSSVAGAVDVDGDLTVNSSSSLDMGANALSVGGDITNDGTLTLTGNTTTLDGGSSQTINSNLIFNNLTINSAGVSLSAPIDVSGLLTLTSGVITCESDVNGNDSQTYASTNNLTIKDGATMSGASASSHVTGAVRVESSSTSEIEFPVGDGTNYRPVFLTPAATTATTYTVEHVNGSHSSIAYDNDGYDNTPCNTGVHHVAMGCWWDIEKSSGGAGAFVGINWDANSNVDVPADMLLTHWNSGTSEWDNISASITDGTGSGSASASDGRVRSNLAQTDFSPFNLGSGSGDNPLPIDLLSFHTVCSHELVDVNFSVLSQVNNDYFLIERSTDAMNWEVVGQIDGVEGGNINTQMDYVFVDSDPLANLSYYRLTQVDFDGKTKTFYPVSTTCGGSEGGMPIDVYPNPAWNDVTVEMELDKFQGDDVYYTITDATGKVMLSDYVSLDRGFNKHKLDISKLPNGVYILRFNQTKDHIKETRIVKR